MTPAPNAAASALADDLPPFARRESIEQMVGARATEALVALATRAMDRIPDPDGTFSSETFRWLFPEPA